MKIDADEKELLESVERGEWEVCQGWQARADSLHALRQGHVPKRQAAEHPTLEQGPGGDPEARTRRRPTLPDVDLEPATQVRLGASQGTLAADVVRTNNRDVARLSD